MEGGSATPHHGSPELVSLPSLGPARKKMHRGNTVDEAEGPVYTDKFDIKLQSDRSERSEKSDSSTRDKVTQSNASSSAGVANLNRMKLPQSARAKDKLVDRSDDSKGKKRADLRESVNSISDNKVSTPHGDRSRAEGTALDTQDMVRLEVFLQSLGLLTNDSKAAREFICDRLAQNAKKPTLKEKKKYLSTVVLLSQKSVDALSLQIASISIQRTVRGNIERANLRKLGMVYHGVDWMARNNAIIDFANNERDYGLKIELIIEKYLKQFDASLNPAAQYKNVLTKVEIDKIFMNVAELQTIHKELLPTLLDLTQKIPHITGFGKPWTTQITLCYGYYVLHSEHCVTTLKRVFDENSKFKSAIIAIYKQVHEIVPDKKKKEGDYAVEALETFLSLLRIPTTRIEFYRKITLEALKQTTELHPDFLDLRRVCSTMEASTALIEKKVKEAKQKDRILEIKRRLETDSEIDLPGRAFVKEGLVTYEKKKVTAILLNDLLILGTASNKKVEGGIKQTRLFALEKNMSVVEHVTKPGEKPAKDKDKTYPVNFIDDKTREIKFTFLTANLAEQTEWIKIIESQLDLLVILNSTVFCAPLLDGAKKAIPQLDEKTCLKKKKELLINPTKLVSDLQLSMYDSMVPPWMFTMAGWIQETKNLTQRGIYRVSALEHDIETLKNVVDALGPFTSDDLSKYPIFATADAFKLYFRRLPVPLLTFELYQPVMALPNYDDDPLAYAAELKTLFEELPLLNYSIAKFLAKHLCYVESGNEHNFMTSSNIAIVFGPSVLYPQEDSLEATLKMPRIYSVVQCMIDHYELIFGEPRPKVDLPPPVAVVDVPKPVVCPPRPSASIPTLDIEARDRSTSSFGDLLGFDLGDEGALAALTSQINLPLTRRASSLLDSTNDATAALSSSTSNFIVPSDATNSNNMKQVIIDDEEEPLVIIRSQQPASSTSVNNSGGASRQFCFPDEPESSGGAGTEGEGALTRVQSIVFPDSESTTPLNVSATIEKSRGEHDETSDESASGEEEQSVNNNNDRPESVEVTSPSKVNVTAIMNNETNDGVGEEIARITQETLQLIASEESSQKDTAENSEHAHVSASPSKLEHKSSEASSELGHANSHGGTTVTASKDETTESSSQAVTESKGEDHSESTRESIMSSHVTGGDGGAFGLGVAPTRPIPSIDVVHGTRPTSSSGQYSATGGAGDGSARTFGFPEKDSTTDSTDRLDDSRTDHSEHSSPGMKPHNLSPSLKGLLGHSTSSSETASGESKDKRKGKGDKKSKEEKSKDDDKKPKKKLSLFGKGSEK